MSIRRTNPTLTRGSLRTILALLAVSLAGGSYFVRPVHATDATTVAVLKRVEAKSRAVAARVLPAVVGIMNQSLDGGGHMGEGSGVVVSEDGLIVTVGHVIAKPGSELTVIFPDGRRAMAKALGANFSRDSGLAKITDPGKWPHVEMGHSDDIKPGTWCMALGHPGGIQQGRTPPIRLGRILNSGKGARFLATDATIISGDSGGPLFDLDGRVIGVHSNIGTNVNQNHDVPIDVYRDQWSDLVAGKAIGSPADLHANRMPDPATLKKFRELMYRRMVAGDPEVRGLIRGGHLNLSPEDIDRLIAKWEKSPLADSTVTASSAGSGGSKPLDFLKFQRLFQDRLLAGDPEVLGLIKNGTMMVTPDQMHRLMDHWEQKGLADASKAKAAAGSNQAEAASDGDKEADQFARLREMLNDAETLGNGRSNRHAAPENSGNYPGRGAAASAIDYGKSSPALLRDVAPIAAQASRSVVVVLCDGQPVALGTVVRKDGYIVTKASELHGKLACQIGPRKLSASVVKSKTEHDLALLKVDANDLLPITWAEGEPPVPGSWLITPAPDDEVLGLGIVSIPARAILDAPKILLRNRAIVGVMLDQAVKEARVHEVSPNLPAAKAGLKPGDVIVKIEGQKTPGFKDVNQVLGKYLPGDKVSFEITRAGKPMTLKLDLVSSDRMAPKVSNDTLMKLSEAGGTISKRHNNFVNALTHDTVLQAADCGGPVVDLDGHAIGLNIARADRTATYAIPAGTLRKVVAELLAGVQ